MYIFEMLPRDCLLRVLRFMAPYELWRIFNIAPKKISIPPGLEAAMNQLPRVQQRSKVSEVCLGHPPATCYFDYIIQKVFEHVITDECEIIEWLVEDGCVWRPMWSGWQKHLESGWGIVPVTPPYFSVNFLPRLPRQAHLDAS